MARSMTGFGAGSASADGFAAQVEVRSVNNRFLKVQSRLPDGCGALEPQIEAAVRDRLNRGAVTVALSIESAATAGRTRLCPEALDGYRADAEAYAVTAGLKAPTDLSSYLRLPGVIREEAGLTDLPEEHASLALQAIGEALEALNAFRAREGAAMAEELRAQVETLRERLRAVADRAPRLADEFRTKLHGRVRDLIESAGAEVDPGDLTREVIVYADKTDVTEEIVRLRTHLDAFDAALSEDAPGRKLDFLTQEINREVNTIGSKVNDADLAGAVVAMKHAVEKLREILQNLE
ncbi:MAG: YicC/YloC family endoribonuclease [Planctomycetota bacterium]